MSSAKFPSKIFDEIIDSAAFGPRFSSDLYSDEGNVLTLRTTDISLDGRIDLRCAPKALIDFKSFEKHFLELGDIVITRSGRVGTTALFTGYDVPVLPGAFLIRFRLLQGVDAKFYVYWFNSYIGQKALHSVARGAAQQNINLTNVRQLVVPFPDFETQTKIANILSRYDDLIENNRRRIQILEESARLLYREWFVHLRFPGHEKTKIIDGVPKGWERCFVPDVIHLNPTEKVEKGSKIRYLPMSCLSTDGMTISTVDTEIRTKSTAVKFRNHDTLLARITPCLENGKTGFVSFLDANEVACGSTEFIVMRGNRVSPWFTYCLARDRDFRELAIKSMTGSSGRQRVQKECFNEYLVPLAPQNLLNEFDEIAGPIFIQIQNLVAQSKSAAESRDLLLPKLMSGEINC